MAWSNSKVFAAFMGDIMDATSADDLDGDTFKVALYNNSITPDNTVTRANSAYNAGVWANTNEQSDAGQWEAAGEALVSNDVTVSTTTVTWDAADLASDTATTLVDVYGCLVYDDTITTPVADPGVCYIYFGGANSVTSGTLTIVWHTSGIISHSVA